MKLLFCYSGKVGSKLIRWTTREPVSHVAIEFDNGLILHSQLLTGVGLDWSSNFRAHHSIPFEMQMGIIDPEEANWTFSDLLTKYVGRKYDIRAFVYLGIRLLGLRLLGLPLPAGNPGDVGRNYLCTELAAAVYGQPVNPMITPYGLYTKLRDERTN
jgi:hypothetical protein